MKSIYVVSYKAYSSAMNGKQAFSYMHNFVLSYQESWCALRIHQTCN